MSHQKSAENSFQPVAETAPASPMLIAAAKAAYEGDRERNSMSFDEPPWKGVSAGRRATYVAIVRDVLEAIRAPDKATEDAGDNPPELKHANWVQLSSSDIWRAMINHILKGEGR